MSAIDKVFLLDYNDINEDKAIYWSLQPFIISDYSSFIVDEKVFDFYITCIDGIAGPNNKQIEKSYVLINAFSLDYSLFNGIKVAISNFWNGNLIDE